MNAKTIVIAMDIIMNSIGLNQQDPSNVIWADTGYVSFQDGSGTTGMYVAGSDYTE